MSGYIARTVNNLQNPIKHLNLQEKRAMVMIKHDLPASRGVRYFLCHVGCAQQQSCVNFQEGKKNTNFPWTQRQQATKNP